MWYLIMNSLFTYIFKKWQKRSWQVVGCLFLCVPLCARGAYHPLKQQFSIVSEENCQKLPTGNLSRCSFPTVRMTELYPSLPPLPFETIVEVNTHRSCHVTGPSGFLQVSTERFQETTLGLHLHPTLEQLAIQHHLVHKVRSDYFLPLGQIFIYPKSDAIFENAIFSKGCTISLEIQLNVIRFDSLKEGQAFIEVLNSKIEHLNTLKAGLHSIMGQLEIQASARSISLQVAGFQDESVLLEQEWESVVKALKQNRNSTQELDWFIPLFENFMENHGVSLKSLSDWFQNIENHTEEHGQTELPNYTERVRQLELQIVKAQSDLALTQDFLEQECSVPALTNSSSEELKHFLRDEVCGPQGLVDQIANLLKNR